FYSKQYYVVGMAYIALYLFLFESKLRGAQYGFLFAGSLVASMVLVCLLCPFYINATFSALFNTVGWGTSIHYAFRQLETFARTYSGLLMVLLIYCCVHWIKTR